MKVEAKHLEVPREYFLKNLGNNDSIIIGKDGSSVRKIADQPTFFSTLRLELAEGLGCLGYVDGGTYPRKGVPDEASTFAINIIKETVKQVVKHPQVFILGIEKGLRFFNAIFNRAFDPYKVNPKYLCPTARQISLIISTFLIEIGVNEDLAKETGYNLCHIFEYDDAYRYRIQDIASEVNLFALRDNPRKELTRLMDVWRERDTKLGVIWKMELYMKPVLLLLYIPKYRRAFLKTLVYIKGMQFDDADWYWASFKGDYNFGGISYETRIKDIKIPILYTIGQTVDISPLDKVIYASMIRHQINYV